MAMVEDIVSGDARVSEATPADYFELLKPKVMRLVVFTALVGMLAAPGAINPFLAVFSILAIAVGAGASGALNMWYDSDIDGVMTRTIKRPVPSGRVTPSEALIFGVILSALSVLTLGLVANWVAAGLLAFTIFFYAVIYTVWLKRSTPQNIVIGGAAGAFPPMIGWACVTGTLTIESAVLFAIIFLWTPPHFWALALWKMRDYDNAGVPMLPNVVGEKKTRDQMLIYAAILLPVTVAPAFLGFGGVAYAIVSTILAGTFLALTYKVWAIAGADPNLKAEKYLFGFSIFFLFAVFATLLIEAVVFRSFGLSLTLGDIF
ncbi:heme o synthase [Ahrensia marina]|uniref:Protoheme IX farnesyltransferase n=1 Tax=Ahrensia marina TaxID=1514904 RepID=A0A0N0E7H4_9HYPH|nr:heme o synthase [Ahrensia marina]KPB01152.1 protoheme IX farnesyltransferase [Ahrensia marina]